MGFIYFLIALLLASAASECLTGEVVVARGRHCADKEPHADHCQTFEHFWHYSFTSDATAKLYRLEVGQLEVPRKSFRGTVCGDEVSTDKFVATSITPSVSRSRALQDRDVMSPAQTRSLLIVVVQLDGTWRSGKYIKGVNNTATNELVDYYLYRQPYSLLDFFRIVSRGQFAYDNDLNRDGVSDIVTVTFTPNDLPDDACTSIQAAVKRKLAGTIYDVGAYQTVAYQGPRNWDCGFGLGVIGNNQMASTWVAMSDYTNLGVFQHELGHNLGFGHSNSLTAVGGQWIEYGDMSCAMSSIQTGFAHRRGFNALQLHYWGVIDAARTQVVPSTTSDVQGFLYNPYYDESSSSSSPPIKIWRLGTGSDSVNGNIWLSYRSPRHPGIDHNTDFSGSGVVPSYSARLLVYRDGVGDQGATLIDSVPEGRSKVFNGYKVTAYWHDDDGIMVHVGPNAPATVQKPVVSPAPAATIWSFTPSVNDTGYTSIETGSASMPSASATAATSAGYEMVLSSQNGTSFVQIPLQIPQGSYILDASLVLEVYYLFGAPEFQNGPVSISVSLADYDSSPALTGNIPATQTFGPATSVTLTGTIRGGQDVYFPITPLLQSVVNRPGWKAGNNVTVKLQGTSANVMHFFSARGPQVVKYFSSPRIRASYANYNEVRCDRTSATLSDLVSCAANAMPKSGFQAPTSAQMSDWQSAVSNLLTYGDCSVALGSSIAANAVVVPFTDGATGRKLCVLTEVRDANGDGALDNGFGMVVVDQLKSLTESVVLVPRPGQGIETEAALLFSATRARALVMAGAAPTASTSPSCVQGHSSAADAMYNTQTLYHAAVVAANAYYSSKNLHWNALQFSLASCGSQQVYVSNGVAGSAPAASDPASKLSSALTGAGISASIASGTCAQSVSDSVQARLLNGVAAASVCTTAASASSGVFVAVQQATAMSAQAAPQWANALRSAIPVQIPSVPMNVVASAGGNTFRVHWDLTARADYYLVRSASTASGPFAMVANVTANAFVDTYMGNGVARFYQVAAGNSAGASAFSNVVNAGLRPDTPQLVNAVPAAQAVTLSWVFDPIQLPFLTGLAIMRSDPNLAGAWFDKQITSVPLPTSYTWTGLTSGQMYSFKIYVKNAYGQSDVGPTVLTVGAGSPATVTATTTGATTWAPTISTPPPSTIVPTVSTVASTTLAPATTTTSSTTTTKAATTTTTTTTTTSTTTKASTTSAPATTTTKASTTAPTTTTTATTTTTKASTTAPTTSTSSYRPITTSSSGNVFVLTPPPGPATTASTTRPSTTSTTTTSATSTSRPTSTTTTATTTTTSTSTSRPSTTASTSTSRPSTTASTSTASPSTSRPAATTQPVFVLTPPPQSTTRPSTTTTTTAKSTTAASTAASTTSGAVFQLTPPPAPSTAPSSPPSTGNDSTAHGVIVVTGARPSATAAPSSSANANGVVSLTSASGSTVRPHGSSQEVVVNPTHRPVTPSGSNQEVVINLTHRPVSRESLRSQFNKQQQRN